MTILQELAAYLTVKLNAIIERLNLLSGILPLPTMENNQGKGFVIKVNADKTGYKWHKTDRLAPYIESVFPMLINYNKEQIDLYVYGGNIDPNTVFELGNQVVLGNADYGEFGLAVIKVTAQKIEFDVSIVAINGSTTSWGDWTIYSRNLSDFVPNNTGSIVWGNVSDNATTGLGFIDTDNAEGWDKSGVFLLDVLEQDFQLKFQMRCTGEPTSGAAAGIAFNNQSDLDYAFKRDYYHVQITEGNSIIGAPIPVSDNTQYAIVRKSDEIFYFIDNRLVRRVSGVVNNDVWFSCIVNGSFLVENIIFEK